MGGDRKAMEFCQEEGLYAVTAPRRHRWAKVGLQRSTKEIGHGGVRDLILAKARKQMAEYRAIVAEGHNPKHVAQWKMTLTVYAAPVRKMIIEEIRGDEVLKFLKPHRARVPETADRLRVRLRACSTRPKLQTFVDGESPPDGVYTLTSSSGTAFRSMP